MSLIKFFIVFHSIVVDGDTSDWIGERPSQIHSWVISEGEFIYRGDINDFRTDLGGDLYYADLREFRVTCDDTFMYFLIKFNDVNFGDMDFIHVEIAIGNPGDVNKYTWIGDDAQLGLSERVLADRIIALHSTFMWSFSIELWDGATWYSPSSNYLAIVNDVQNCVEAKISLADIADDTLKFPSAIRIALATFKNVVGSNNDVDATEDIGGVTINDALDVMGGTEGVSENAWNRDLSDNVVNKFFDIAFETSGDAAYFNRIIDGDPGDWGGVLPIDIHDTLYFDYEWIYKGDTGDMRTDPIVPNDSVFDLVEFRITSDTINIYFMAKFSKMDFEQTQIAISLDSDSNTNDNSLTINGDDTGTILANPVQYSEREILLTADSVDHAEIFLFADDGSIWYTPPSPYKIAIDPLNNTLEARIQLVDLNINPGDTIIISAGIYDANVQGTGNSPNGSDDPGTPGIEEGDMSVDYPTCDAIDLLGGVKGISENAWDRDLSDGDIDFYYIVHLEKTTQLNMREFGKISDVKNSRIVFYGFSPISFKSSDRFLIFDLTGRNRSINKDFRFLKKGIYFIRYKGEGYKIISIK